MKVESIARICHEALRLYGIENDVSLKHWDELSQEKRDLIINDIRIIIADGDEKDLAHFAPKSEESGLTISSIVRALSLEAKSPQPEHLKMKQYEFRAVINKVLQHPVFDARSEKEARKKAVKEHPGIYIISCREL